MAFLAICTALYDYVPQGEGELPIHEGELLYILEKSADDDWWKAKKKADEENDEEPVGLIPNNYVEETTPSHTARAVYDYSRQTDEELSFSEDDVLHVYDTSDPDWTLVGLNGEYGFVPANYIDEADDGVEQEEEEESPVASPPLPARPPAPTSPEEPTSPARSMPAVHEPAANLAAIMGGQAPARAPPRPAIESPREESEEEEAPPPMPARPDSGSISSPPFRELSPVSPEPSGPIASPLENRYSRGQSQGTAGHQGPGGYHLYNINEMVAVMGKMKKMPTTLGINLGMGVILVMPEKKRDGPQQEWTAEKLTHYSIEGKHVFVDLVKPSKSFDFHAGAKDTATEIVAMLGEMAGVAKAEGLREVIAAGSGGMRSGFMTWEFMAQGEDEVTVAEGDEVIVLDDTLSEEWWKVRRVKNGKEGVVPSSYVEITGLVSPPPQVSPQTPISAGLSTKERNRLEEERLAREAVANAPPPPREEPEPKSSKRSSRTDSRPKSKPENAKLRMWTDRSGSFKVEAQFIGLKDGKIHLHKVNGVKIAVPVGKMSTTDIEYVERATGKSLDDEKPLADSRARAVNGSSRQPPSSSAQPPSKPEYDWFDFFLKCGVSPYQCERYSYNFNKDSMDESILPDINPTVLRNLGLKEGDILRVMKYIDTQFGRTGDKTGKRNVSFGPDEVIGENGEEGGGLFSGPGGALKNNTRKGRPAPTVQTNDTIDSKVLERGDPQSSRDSPEDTPPPPPAKDNVGGFDDNAWEVKPSKQPPRPQQPAQATRAQTATPPVKATSPPPPAMTPGMAELSLLTQPLQPTPTSPAKPVQQPPNNQQLAQQPPVPQLAQQPNQQQGANPSFFSQLNAQSTGLPQSQQPPQQLQQQPQQQLQQQPQQQGLNVQPTGQFQFNAPRQRPQAPQTNQQGPLMPPPPARPLSAPQNASAPSNFPAPLQAQMTGYVNTGSPPPNLNQLRQANQMQPQFTNFNPQGPNFSQPQQQFSPQAQGQMQPQMTGFQPQQQQQQQPQPQYSMNGQGPGQQVHNFAQSLQPQATGFQGFQAQPTGLMPQPTGSINSMLPPALQPQSTGANGTFGRPGFGQAQPQPPMPSLPAQYQQQGTQSPFQPGAQSQFPPPTNPAQFQQNNQQQIPPPPPIPQQPTAAPLQPQPTGPAPNVKFGVQAKKLAAQPTGRKANLAHATPDNPFGF